MAVIRRLCLVAIAGIALVACAQPGDQPADPTKGPRITALQVSTNRVSRGGIVDLLVTAQSPDDSKLSYYWSTTQGMISDPRAAHPQWRAPDSAFGQDTYVTVSVRVTDDKQRQDTRQETIAVTD
ncbi:MAG TPA: hypothetical protein V6D00_14190 [Pantanalinema sp.]